MKGRADFTVVNCYTPAKCTTFQWLSEVGGGSRWLVTGDFNVRDSSWEKGFEYSSPTLTGQINDSNFIVLNDGSFTRIPDRSDQGQTAIDLTFASADIADGVGWEVGEDSLSSDHLPIVISMCGTAEVGCPAPVSKYNYDKANWDLFRSLLGSKDVDIGQADIEEVNSQIISSILAAARVAIPTSSSGTPRPNSNPWWNKDCEEAVKEKRMRYRFYCRIQNAETHEEMKAANRNCNRTLAQAKKDHWMSFTESVSTDQQDLGAVWRKIKKMKGQVVAPEYDLRQGDSVYSTDQAKADAFAEAFAEASDCDSLPADMRRRRRDMEADYSDPEPDDSLTVNSPLTLAELKRALSAIKKVKVSTGVDTVSYHMLREVPESFLKTVLGFFQRCWEGGAVPSGWKHAVVVPIHKHGKPRKELGSYRPISLTSHLGKVFERVVKHRLEYFCESKKVFPACQAGFRRGRGVTDHLVKLGEHVGRALGKRKVLLSCFFDVSRAYDQVWHAKLLQKLQKIGISGKMYDYIKTFLSGRSMQVRWKGAMSAVKTVSMGVPQGSVIAPLLFNIMVHDVVTAVTGKVVITMYADDLAIWLDTHIRRLFLEKSTTVKRFMKLFQAAVDGVLRFMRENGFTLSIPRTVFIPFHTNNLLNRNLHVRINMSGSTIIFASKNVKYLGVSFSRQGRTNLQVDNNSRNASRALSLIKALSAQPWANSPKTLVSLVRCLVRSRLTYGLEAMPHITDTGLARLTRIEVHGLRIALGLPQSAPHSLVYREAGVLPLGQHIQLSAAKYKFRCQTVSDSTAQEVEESFRGPAQGRLCSSICDSIRDLVRGAGVDGARVAERPIHPYPPWLMERANVQVGMGNLRKEENPLVAQFVANEFLERNYKNFLEIYTDGSVLDDGAAGAAFVVPEFNNMTHSFSLPAVSVYTAELVAILMALQHMSAIHTPPSAIVICSDSKAALSSIGSNAANAREDLVSEIVTTTHQLITRGTEVRFQWVPAHVSLSGNEKADRAAKRGAEGTESAAVNLDLGLADIYSRLTVQVWRQWGEEFRTQALARDWADRTSPCRDGIFFPGVPTHLARIMHRIHMDWWRVMFVPTPCVCGEPVSFYHILFKCINCTDQVKPLSDKLISLGLPLCIQSLAVRHQQEGWSLLRAAARLIYSRPMAACL